MAANQNGLESITWVGLGSIFIASSNTELVLHLIAKSKAKTFLLRAIDACEKLRAAYLMVLVLFDGFRL